MKKLIAILFVLALVAMLPLSALAATGINQYEQAVLDKIASCQLVDETGKVIDVPQEYINAARNYFLGDFEMTEEQMHTVMAKINESVAVVQKDVAEKEVQGNKVGASEMDSSTLDAVLNLGQQAATEVKLNMSFDSQSNQVVISSKENNNTVFTTGGIIKTTGKDFTVTSGMVIAAVAAVLVLGTAAIFGVSKKAGLLVK
jgi:hypothetical protein